MKTLDKLTDAELCSIVNQMDESSWYRKESYDSVAAANMWPEAAETCDFCCVMPDDMLVCYTRRELVKMLRESCRSFVVKSSCEKLFSSYGLDIRKEATL